jgi:hypothetical protein
MIPVGVCCMAAFCGGCNNSDIVAARKSGGQTVYGAPQEDRSPDYRGNSINARGGANTANASNGGA